MKVTVKTSWIAVLISVCLSSASFSESARAQGTEHFFENASSQPILPLLAQAKHSIDIEIYEMNDPLVLQALQKAVLAKVRVRVVQDYDTVANPCKIFSPVSAMDAGPCQTQKKMVTFVNTHGGQYVAFNKNNLCANASYHCFEHGKMIIIDGRRALLSTGNFNTSSLCDARERPVSCNRDYSMISDDPNVVNTLMDIFQHDLLGAAYNLPALMQAHGSVKLTVSPYSLAPLVAFIKSAQKTVQIQNQYLKDPELNAALVEVAKRGVQVFVNVSSFCSYGTPTPADVTKYEAVFGEFDRVGIHTRLFTRKIPVNNVAGYLHAKAILVDSSIAWVGSVNGSQTSLSNNREFGIFFNDASEVHKLAAFMYADYTHANGENWRDSLTCQNDVPAPTSGGEGFIPGYFAE